MCREAPLFTERTSVGLDVHARSVAATAIDGLTGELVRARLSPAVDEIRGWVQGLPGPVAVTYEAGPTGFGLYRALTAAGIRFQVAAPSKLIRPPGERVKTDDNDAFLLARLLRLDEITPVAVPTVEQETARDLVRAREDVRKDLMSARHRGVQAAAAPRPGLLRRTGLDRQARRLGAGTAIRPARHPGRVRGNLRRGALRRRPPAAARYSDRGDGRRQSVHRAGAAAGLPARDRHPDRVRARGRDRRLAP